MFDTKETILQTALRLFARDGYEAVSVSRIAAELGITKGALYKHYRNKRAVFDSIVERMYQIDTQRAGEYEVPKETYEAGPEDYRRVSIESIKKYTISQFEFWSRDRFASDFRKMLTLEQYRNAEMAELYRNCLTAGPVAYMEDIFGQMMQKGLLKEANPRQLALEFYAPLYLLVSISDSSKEKETLGRLLNQHIECFFRNNAGDRF